ncbi:MAG: AMP-binding protein [Planctomycetaceae bacterium]|nr:AMP-binding protein [Planctomycetaceae bacterium]
MPDVSCNVARRLAEMAQARPDAVAVAEPLGRDRQGRRQYRSVTFRQLDHDSDRIARGLLALGTKPGTRLALLVRPSIDFISLVFGLFKSGAVTILIDPGMGRRSLLRCLAEADPEGFLAMPVVHAVRVFRRSLFPHARWNVTVGRRWFWGGPTLDQLRGGPWDGSHLAAVTVDQPAAIIFTSGSTGAPKGVLFTHGNFDAQAEQIRDFFDIQPGGVDVPAFPLFGLFNCAMGTTAVIPDMDSSRPASVNPENILEAVRDWQATQSFASPAVWDRVSQYCLSHGKKLPTIRRVLSSGAPVSPELLRRVRACIHPEGDMHTPYGATESLPVASISSREVLGEASEPGTAEQTRLGAGVCVGHRFSKIRWRVIRIVDGPIPSIDQAEPLPTGQIGELIVQGPQVTRAYVTRTEANRLAKIADGDGFWHRIGDSGYLDRLDRFWFCGRVAHRVQTATGPMYPICCEAIFNAHPAVRRSALVGVGMPGRQRPVLIVEPAEGHMPKNRAAREQFFGELRALGATNPQTASLSDFLLHHRFPVDIRHNAKIFREKLAVWAARQLASR